MHDPFLLIGSSDAQNMELNRGEVPLYVSTAILLFILSVCVCVSYMSVTTCNVSPQLPLSLCPFIFPLSVSSLSVSSLSVPCFSLRLVVD